MSNKISVGIMQGRLSHKHGKPLQSFPLESWRDEFARAADIGYEQIEWLVDNNDNPITTVEGRAEIKALTDQYNIGIHSLCAHTFIDGSLLSGGNISAASTNYLSKVMNFASESNIEFVILPVMDRMSLRTMAAKECFSRILYRVLSESSSTLLLESDLSGFDLKKFVEDVGSPKIGVLYDLGNSNALGLDISSDLSVLGSLVREVHIKDRMSDNGPSYRLGEGDTPFSQVAQTLSALSWRGPVVLETPVYNNWRIEAERNLAFTLSWINQVYNQK